MGDKKRIWIWVLMRQYLKQIYNFLAENIHYVGLASLSWFLLRSGTKPSRVLYPCQQVAASQSINYMFYILSSLPVIGSYIHANLHAFHYLRHHIRKHMLGFMTKVIIIFLIVAVLSYTYDTSNNFLKQYEIQKQAARAAVTASGLTLMSHSASAQAENVSDVFVVQNVPQGVQGYGESHQGVEQLINLMGGNGLKFYNSPTVTQTSGPDGIIGRDDVVVIKINEQNGYNASTNIDVVRGLIYGIVNHPDGFTGEVVIAENTIWTNKDWHLITGTDLNSDNASHSYNGLVDYWSDSYNVSLYRWHLLTSSVSELEHSINGYYTVSSCIKYPKFTTSYNTRIDMHYGIWNGSEYNNSRLKLINVPVLKNHYGVAGATAALKNYFGITNKPSLCHDNVTNGIMGELRTHIRDADLDVIDAIHVTYHYGPKGLGSLNTRVDMLLSSTDAVAVDYYAVKYVLLPLMSPTELKYPDPDNESTIFHKILESSATVLNSNGTFATMNESEMNIYAYDFNTSDLSAKTITYIPASPSPGESVTITVVIENSGDKTATGLNNVNISLFSNNILENSKIVDLINKDNETVNFSWTAIVGEHNITIAVDPDNEIDESNEGNNEIWVMVNVGYGCDVYCSNCSDCETKLNWTNATTVCLNSSIWNHSGTCINFPANNKTFDCQGNTIDGNGTGNGIYLNNKSGNIIRNCVVTDFYFGIFLALSPNNTLANNTASSKGNGIYLGWSSNNTLTNNTVHSNNHSGIYLDWFSSNNTITNNTAHSNNNSGIYLENSSNNNIINNTAHSNAHNGIYLYFSPNNMLTNNIVNLNDYGIYLDNSDSNNLINNTIENNNNTGVYFNEHANNNNLTSNLICSNGLDVNDSDSNSGDENTCDTTNNWNDTGAVGCTHYCNFPDLAVTNITCTPQTPAADESVNITAAIKNLENINLNLSNVNVSLFIDNIYEQSKIINLKTEINVTFNWTAVFGEYNVTVTIDPNNEINESDESNNNASKLILIQKAPTSNAGPDQWTYAVKEALTFDGSNSYDTNGTIIDYSWNFGVGEGTGSGTITNHKYNTPGNYMVTLTVTDNEGATDSDTVNVTIYIQGDVDHDWCVELDDLTLFGEAHLTNPGDADYDANADFTNNLDPPGGLDYEINAMDVAKLALNYNKCA